MDFDLELFYQEQDKRMSLPDEDIDEYLARIGAHRAGASQGPSNLRNIVVECRPSHESVVNASPLLLNASTANERYDDMPGSPEGIVLNGSAVKLSASHAKLNPSNQAGMSSHIHIEVIDKVLDSPLTPPVTNAAKESSRVTPEKRKALEIGGPDAFPSNKRRKSPGLGFSGTDSSPKRSKASQSPKAAKEPIWTSSPLEISSLVDGSSVGGSSSPQLSKTPQSSNVGKVIPQASSFDISYLVEDSSDGKPSSPGYVPTSSTPVTPAKPVHSRLKRKLSQDEGTSSQHKKKAQSLQGRSLSPSIEDITSFSASLRGQRKVVSPRQLVKTKARVNAPKIPALDLLKAFVPPVPNAGHVFDPPTSPIETTFDITNNALTAAPSKLYLDVKRRVAQHASTRRKDKVIKLPSKPKESKDVGNVTDDDDSVIYISSGSSSSVRSSPPRPTSSASAKGSTKKVRPSSKVVTKEKEKEKPKPKDTKSKKKEKPPPITPVEYAQKLRDKWQEKAALTAAAGVEQNSGTKRRHPKFLEGKTFIYIGGDMQYASETTRGRMDIIVRNGGNLLPRYDASLVTHIVTDAPEASTLRALGLKRLSDIPDHIPTVTWSWIAKAIFRAPNMTKDGPRVRMDPPFVYAAFLERIDAGSEPLRPSVKGKGKEKANSSSEEAELSRISDFTQDRPLRPSSAHSVLRADVSRGEGGPGAGHGSGVARVGGSNQTTKVALLSPPTSPVQLSKSTASSSRLPIASSSKTKADDPLAEFYAQARAEHESKWARHGEVAGSEAMSEVAQSEDESDREEPLPVQAPRKRGWTCDTKEVQRQTCANQDIIEKLEELKALHQAKLGDEDRWRVFSYSKCIRALRNHPKRIASFAEARAIRGVGEKTAAKVMEIIETGNLRRIKYEKTDDLETTRIFQGVYGVGQTTAYQWYVAGCRTLKDVTSGKGGVKLTPAQEIGIRFYDDINDRMPREEAREIFELIKPVALKIDPKLFVEIMGSYRRGKADCGDIDIMITRCPNDGKTHEGVLSKLLSDLHKAGIITEDLAVPEDPDDLEAIYRGLCHVPGRKGAKRRRIDFLTVPWQSRGAALLYYTGDDIFNRAIRMKANVLGYSLNQKGLFSGVVRDPRDRRIKLNQGSLLASETEQEIFKILNVPWQEPHERVRG